MKIAAVLVALITIAVRVAMGFVLILAASSSRWPRSLRALGAVMCVQAIAANLFGLERAGAIMEWEAMQGTTLLRAGRRSGLGYRGFRSVCVYKEAVRGAEENSSLATTEHHPRVLDTDLLGCPLARL